ncbi:hypothetical protein CDAR_465631 [Caerostris darwini]|uniref:Uncharacterized protein n=1 Tax=Caerostris darwini TaxID=1538125 RepID=A0AAV4TVK9_9ARAC|nr:hypothetical protein CDAR_465631 [Caerostris darwini]
MIENRAILTPRPTLQHKQRDNVYLEAPTKISNTPSPPSLLARTRKKNRTENPHKSPHHRQEFPFIRQAQFMGRGICVLKARQTAFQFAYANSTFKMPTRQIP